jgi:FixJ family two-component response regulator
MAAPADPPVVYVIDDNPAVLASLEFALELEGFLVRTSTTGEELAGAVQPEWACLVVDYNLSPGNGLDLIDDLRRRGIAWPAILMTTAPSPALRRRAAEADVRIVEKPLLGNALVDTIKQAFGG